MGLTSRDGRPNLQPPQKSYRGVSPSPSPTAQAKPLVSQQKAPSYPVTSGFPTPSRAAPKPPTQTASQAPSGTKVATNFSAPATFRSDGNVKQQPPAPLRHYSSDSALSSLQSILPPDPQSSKKPVTTADLEAARAAAKREKHNSGLQLDLAKKLVEAASLLSVDNGATVDPKIARKNAEKWTTESQKIVKKLASSSKPNLESMFYLASCYGSGKLGLEPSREKEFELYKKATKLGHGRSAYRAAVCLEVGSGVKADKEKALAYYKHAAQLENAPAMYKLGMIYLQGLLGNPRNVSEALIWLKRAADRADSDCPHALYELAKLYESADGSSSFLEQDEVRALELYQRAAQLGHLPSQYRVGAAYEYGHLGCIMDPKLSIAWYSRAASKGDAESELGLSGWYLTGADGILPKSEAESYLWARRASEKGLAKAEYAVGYFTENGIGTTANMHEAIRWYKKAASQNYQKAINRLRDLGM
ncbi:HCP-like protein [Dipodascopsis uninucleata]